MKTLIIVIHPDSQQSVVNRRWIEEVKKQPETYTVHDLAQTYPDGVINVAEEQRLVEAHDTLVFQFPLFWFSGPPLLKQWLDDVLTHGWAYGRETGDKLTNRKIALAVTAGIQAIDYHQTGRYHFTLKELLTPYEATFRYYCHADYRPFFAFNGTETVPGEAYASTEAVIEKSAKDYLNFLATL